MKRNKLRGEIKRRQDKLQKSSDVIQRLRDKHEPKIVELVGVAPAGPDEMLRVGYTADGRWVSRIEVV